MVENLAASLIDIAAIIAFSAFDFGPVPGRFPPLGMTKM
jgi:hypothetical protein